MGVCIKVVITIATIALAMLPATRTDVVSPGPAWSSEIDTEKDTILIQRLSDRSSGGLGYTLVYRVDLPIDVYWKFKIDFDNDFLVENKYITEHRVLSSRSRVVITENRYTYKPEATFRWQTHLFPERYRLEFKLLNPEQVQQRYHFGSIQLTPDPPGTRVTQTVIFDFWGASLWALYPWKGGMKDFLNYTARWEQETVMKLKDRYKE